MDIRITVKELGLFTTNAQLGLYVRALGWCKEQVQGKHEGLPVEWVIPDYIIRSWNARATAQQLVEHRIWGHRRDGYHFVHISKFNDTDRARAERKRDRQRKAQSAGTLITPIPTGNPTGNSRLVGGL